MKLMVGIIAGILFTSCAIIRPGEVGVKQTFGKMNDRILDQGAHFYNPFVTKIIKTSIRIENLELSLNLPSKEGLNVGAEISILYRIQKERVPNLITEIGSEYEDIIKSVFRSASADVCSKFLAKDMHSGKRDEIEHEILAKMADILEEKGIIIEAVLLKSIKLPDGLYKSIESKLSAEQDALRMQFILEQEKLEAERKKIEAEGERDAQIIRSEGLTDQILELKRIEALFNLMESPNSKIIVTSGESPLMLGGN